MEKSLLNDLKALLEAIVLSLADSCKTDRARPFALLPIDVNRTSKMKRTRYIFLRSSLFWKDEVRGERTVKGAT